MNPKLKRINAVLQTVTDPKTIDLLNRYFWAEYFKLKGASADAVPKDRNTTRRSRVQVREHV
jgi:hypothetical protein